MAWFGADPGGTDKFGVALLHSDGSFESAVVSCADEAIDWLARTGASIEAAGIRRAAVVVVGKQRRSGG